MNINGKHISYFEVLRGIAILFVIINHSYEGNPMAVSMKDQLYLIIRQIVIPAVPLFLAESGFFLAGKEFHDKKSYFGFVINHSFRVWLPMVIWSFPLFLFKDHHGHHLFFAIYWLVGGYSIYYFITLIIQYYLMQPLLRKINLGGVFLSLVITCVSTAFVCYLTAIQGRSMGLLVTVGSFPVWLVYPALGYYIRKKGTNYQLWPWVIVTIIGIVACTIETKLLYPLHSSGIGATKLSAILYSCGLIMVIFNDDVKGFFENYSQSKLYKALLYIGEISFGIYLTHKYFLDYLVSRIVDDMLIRAAITTILTIIFISLVKIIIPKFANNYLGFK